MDFRFISGEMKFWTDKSPLKIPASGLTEKSESENSIDERSLFSPFEKCPVKRRLSNFLLLFKTTLLPCVILLFKCDFKLSLLKEVFSNC